jgi:hypothetical protein
MTPEADQIQVLQETRQLIKVLLASINRCEHSSQHIADIREYILSEQTVTVAARHLRGDFSE